MSGLRDLTARQHIAESASYLSTARTAYSGGATQDSIAVALIALVHIVTAGVRVGVSLADALKPDTETEEVEAA